MPKICVCADHYYDTGNLSTGNVICNICDITCDNCVSTATTCTSCIGANQRYLLNSSCVCTDGFYNPVVPNASCLPCHYSCLTCSGPTLSNVNLFTFLIYINYNI